MCFNLPMTAPDAAVRSAGAGPTTARVGITVQQDEVLTGEAVALDVQPLGFFLRALGTIIDVAVAALLFVALSLAVNWVLGINPFAGNLSGILSVVMIVLVTVILPTVVETLTHGRSLGKLAVGGRIVRSDGGAAGLRQAFVRAIVGVLEIWMTFGAIAALVGAFTPRSQRLGDLLAGTYSERTRTPRLPDGVLLLPPQLAEWAAVADVARLPDRLARRCAQFVRQADRMEPAARQRLAASLAAESATHVSPVPPVDPETFVRGVVSVRRDRELTALVIENRRLAQLSAGVSAAPRGFPQR
jgi:uncharacterized RDD family membrane protein YckC